MNTNSSILIVTAPPALRPLGTLFPIVALWGNTGAISQACTRTVAGDLSFNGMLQTVLYAAFVAFCCYLLYHNLLRRERLVLYRPGVPAPCRHAIASSDVLAIGRLALPRNDIAAVRHHYLGLGGEKLLLRTAHGTIRFGRRLPGPKFARMAADIEAFCGRPLLR